MNNTEGAASRRWVLSLIAVVFAISLFNSTGFAEEEGGIGPDVTVYSLPNARDWGSEGSIYSYSVGTTSCNQGDRPLNWCASSAGCAPGAEETDHPVIGQNLYRLKDGRFEQIGMSWLKHGFLALANSAPECGDGSCDNPNNGALLGVGCTDPYGSFLNGERPLGPRSVVDASTGQHPVRPNDIGSGNIEQRMQVEAADIDPDQNVGALYWVEGHYIAPDDAIEGNGLNNASYRAATFDEALSLSLTGSTIRERAGVYAWQAADPVVEVLNVDIPQSVPVQRFHAGRRVTDGADPKNLAPGGDTTWHYEYVVHNLNSDRGARLFRVQFPGNVDITNAGFRDVDHHSGEPYATTDWDITIDGPSGTVEWSTDTFASDEDANALRWGTMFSFWFDADLPPDGATHTLEFFKPGQPTDVGISFVDGFLVFQDGVETGTTSAWSETQP